MFQKWYTNKKLEYQANYDNGVLEGTVTWWHENGQKKEEGEKKWFSDFLKRFRAKSQEQKEKDKNLFDLENNE